MATGRGGLGASGSRCRSVRVGVGKGGGARRGNHMKGPGFDCAFLEEERVSHDKYKVYPQHKRQSNTPALGMPHGDTTINGGDRDLLLTMQHCMGDHIT